MPGYELIGKEEKKQLNSIFSNGGIERISNSHFDKVIVTNTLNQDRHQDKIQLYN